MNDVIKKAKAMTKIAYLFLVVAIVFFILQFQMPAQSGWMAIVVVVTFIIYIILKYKARGMIKKAAADDMTR